MRANEVTRAHLNQSLRSFVNGNTRRFPFQQYVRIVYNDALTYDEKSNTGGLRANFMNAQVARAPINTKLQGLIQELAHRKANVEDVCYDKISMADYVQGAAMVTLEAAGGPKVLDDFMWGRKDADQSNLGSVDNIPTADNYRSNMEAKGFSNEAIVALASIEAFGTVVDPSK